MGPTAKPRTNREMPRMPTSVLIWNSRMTPPIPPEYAVDTNVTASAATAL